MNKVIAAAAALLFLPALALAEPGITANEILIGQDIDMSGAIAVRMKPLMQAADAYIEKVNKEGGVNGRKIRVVRTDSANKPDKTKENVKTLVEKDGVFAMWGISGTGNTAAALPYLDQHKVPLIGSTSGADSFYEKTHPMLFNLKAGYGDEIRRMASHLKDTYLDKVGILYMDNGFGKETYKTAMAAAEANKLKVVSSASFKEDGSDIAQAVAKVAAGNPPAVLMLSLSGPAPKVVQEYAKTGHRTQIFALSIIASDALYKAVGDGARGIIVTQVMPFPSDRNVPIVRDYQNLVGTKGVKDYSHAGIEGYLLARSLVEGLQGAGRNPTREGLLRAFENMKAKDLGGVKLDFAPNRHNGSDFVEITMIGRGGKLIR
jgi:ABC-type branched-subunit amino acid transport system substrate-binding protein